MIAVLINGAIMGLILAAIITLWVGMPADPCYRLNTTVASGQSCR